MSEVPRAKVRQFEEGEQFRLLVQSVFDYAIYMLDPDGFICSWNEGARRIKGYDDDEIIGQHFSKFYEQADRDADAPSYGLRMARDHGRYEKEGWRLRKNGERFWANVVVDPIWKDGVLVGFAKITRDITEQHQSALRLKEAEAALMHSKKIEAIGRLTLGLSHDFNNLLAVIVNSLDLIKIHRADAARVDRHLEGALRAADRGTLLTRQLLAFARGQTLAPEQLEVNEFINSSKELLLRSCGPDTEIVFSLADDLPEISADPSQLEAALLNLVINSRDAFTTGGTIQISTEIAPERSAHEQPKPIRYIAITVADDGPGMSEEVLQQAVQPFFTTKDVGRGSGLGLSQVHGFAAQSGGDMQINSVLGQGTTVVLRFPVLEA